MRYLTRSGSDLRLVEITEDDPIHTILECAVEFTDVESIPLAVDSLYPDVFSVALNTPICVYTTRYVELSLHIRNLIASRIEMPLRQRAVASVTFTVLSELLLCRGFGDHATFCFLKAWLPDGHKVQTGSGAYRDLLGHELSEAYLAIRYFGLAHELGHGADVSGCLPSSLIPGAIARVSEEWTDFDVVERDRVLRLLEPGSDGPEAKAMLREMEADAFAFGVLFTASLRLSDRLPDNSVRWDLLIVEVILQFQVMWLMERCHSNVRLLDEGAVQSDDFTVAPVAVRVRLYALIEYAVLTVGSHLHGFSSESIESAGRDDALALGRTLQLVKDRISELVGELLEHLTSFEAGLMGALSLTDDDRSYFELLGRATSLIPRAPNLLASVREFCAAADRIGVSGERLEALRFLAEFRGDSTS